MEKINLFLEKVSKDTKYSEVYNKAKTLKEVSELATVLNFKISIQEFEEYFKKFKEDNGISNATGIPESNSFINDGWYSGD